jgi:hypothetical protein
MREKINVCRIALESLKGRHNLEDIGVDARIILKVTLNK